MGPQGQGGIKNKDMANGTATTEKTGNDNDKKLSKSKTQFAICICILGLYNCLLLATLLCVPMIEPFSRLGWEIRKWNDDDTWNFFVCSNVCLINLFTAFFISVELITYVVHLLSIQSHESV
jgi:hypothetical protein